MTQHYIDWAIGMEQGLWSNDKNPYLVRAFAGGATVGQACLAALVKLRGAAKPIGQSVPRRNPDMRALTGLDSPLRAGHVVILWLVEC